MIEIFSNLLLGIIGIRMLVHFIFSLWLVSLCSMAQAFNLFQPASSEGLRVQLFSTQTTVTTNSKSIVFLNLQNMTEYPINNIVIRLFPTENLDFFIVKWPDMEDKKVVDANEYPISQIPPFSYKTVRIALGVNEKARFVNFTAIFEISYTRFRGPSEPLKAALYKSLDLKTGPIEDIGILGVPISLAIYIVPGLMALIVFVLFVPSLPRIVEDNKYLAGFVISLLILYGIKLIGSTSDQPSVSIYELLLLAGLGLVFGGVAGWIVKSIRQRHLPSYEQYPPPDTEDLGFLLVTYLRQTNSVESRPVRLATKMGEVFSGLPVKKENGKDVFLLPRQYRIQVVKENKLIRQLKEAYEKAKAFRVARILERLRDKLEVVDGSKKINEDLEESFDSSFRPYFLPGTEIVRWNWEESRQLLFFDGILK